MIRSLPLTSLSLLLGFFFIFVGLIKVTPNVNPDIYKDMKQEFGRFNKVFPFYKYTGWRPLAKNLRLTVGITEIVCGSVLVVIPGPAKELASIILLGLMGGGFYTHYALKDSFERMAPSLIFGLLVICRLIILKQVMKKEHKQRELIMKYEEDHNQSDSENTAGMFDSNLVEKDDVSNKKKEEKKRK